MTAVVDDSEQGLSFSFTANSLPFSNTYSRLLCANNDTAAQNRKTQQKKYTFVLAERKIEQFAVF
jgi:hypothetical protein